VRILSTAHEAAQATGGIGESGIGDRPVGAAEAAMLCCVAAKIIAAEAAPTKSREHRGFRRSHKNTIKKLPVRVGVMSVGAASAAMLCCSVAKIIAAEAAPTMSQEYRGFRRSRKNTIKRSCPFELA